MIGRGRRVKAGAILVVAGLVIVALLILIQQMMAGVQMRSLYEREVESQLKKTNFAAAVFTAEDLMELPKPVQRYFRYAGFLGQSKMSTTRMVFNDVNFKNGNLDLKLSSEQINFTQRPARIAYMNSKIMGLIPFEGRDKYQDGQGFMTGKLGKLVTIFDVTGPEMNQSALATFLAEILVAPSCALQDYIVWEEMDENHARATITDKGNQASGVFTFNELGEFVMFRTEDRYMDRGKDGFALVPWRAEIVGYHEEKGLMVPSRLKAIWEMPEGDLVYFDGELTTIEFDVRGL